MPRHPHSHHQSYRIPAGNLTTFLIRWFGENKTTITGAGNRTSSPVLRSGCPRLVIQEAWARLTATQLVRASEAAALRTQPAAARALRRRNQQEVTADEESFTTALRHAIRSMASTQVTASSSLHALAAAADAAARAAPHTLNIPGRQRRSPRAESTPEIPPRLRDKDDRHRKTPGHRIPALASHSPRQHHSPRERRNRPASAGPRTVEPRDQPPATRGHQPYLRIIRKRTSGHARNTRPITPQEA